ncbi:MAG TPA: OmpA family protein [Sphingomicrobium sp.]|nr:OmpA family protein [Sphingomicrobium sp.]
MILFLTALLQTATSPPNLAVGDATCPNGAIARSGEACPPPRAEGSKQICPAAQEVAADRLCPPPQTFRIFFDSSKAELSRDGQTVITEVVRRWQKVSGTRLTVEGHSDRSGSPTANQLAADRRARAVAEALAAAGVDRRSLVVTALGEDRPLIVTDDGVREPQNRRVDISFAPR